MTGNEHWSMPGMSLEARGPGIDFGLAYNSLAAMDSDSFGYGWRDPFGMLLAQTSSGDVSVTQENGATVPFAKITFGSSNSGLTYYLAPDVFDATLAKNSDGTWTFTRHHREIFNFDAAGRLTSIADRNGYATTLTYGTDGVDHVVDDAGHRMNVAWSSGKISSISDVSDPAKVRTMTFGYDSDGNLTSYRDIGGGLWSMTYDTTHRLQTVQSPRFAGTSTTRQFHYDSQGRVDWEQDQAGRRTNLYYGDPATGSTRIVDPAGHARVDSYNAQGQRTSVTLGYGTPSASTTQYVYDTATGMVTDRIDGNGKHWKSVFGDSANPFSPTQTTDPMGRVRTMTYTASGDLATLTDANGTMTTYGYDANGNPTTTVVGAGTPSAATTQFVYGDSAHPGQPTSMVDARGRTWTYVDDPATGDLTKVTDPEGGVTTWTYYPQGWVHTKVSPRGNVGGATPADFTTTYTYDSYGQIASTADPLGHVTHRTYDADGNIDTVTDGAGRKTKYAYTDGGQVAAITRGFGTTSARTTAYTYWPDGNLKTSAAQPTKVWTMTWDAAGRLSTKSDPDGDDTSYSYDDAGNRTGTTTAAGTADESTTAVTYDDDSRPSAVTVGEGTTSAIATTLGYDIAAGTAPCTAGPVGTVYCTTSTTGGGTIVRFYDARDDLIKLVRPGGKSTSYTYDGAGSVLSAVKSSGSTSAWTYTGTGLLKTSADGDPADEASYTYDPDGNRASMADATGTSSYTYDHADRLTSTTDASGAVVGYSYDDADQPQSLTYPDGRIVSYVRNGAGDVDTLTDDTGAFGGQATNFDYSADGTPIAAELPNGDTVTTGLDGEDRPTSLALNNAAGTPIQKLAYTYDHGGRIAGEADTGVQAGGQSYSYDATGRLASSTDATTGTEDNYGYDPAGNAVRIGATTQTFDASSQLQTSTTAGSQTSYDYDSDGNLTGVTPPTGAGSKFTYTAADRVKVSTTPTTAAPRSLYHPVTLARVADTNAHTGYCTSTCTAIAAGGTLTVHIAGNGGIPTSGANAVTLSVTTLNNTANGYVRVYASGSPVPGGRSMSVIGGTTQSNTVISEIGADGNLQIFSSVATDVAVDVTGWYSDPEGEADTSGSALVTVGGTRLLDTRNGTGVCNPSPCSTIAAGGHTAVQIGGKGSVPNANVAAAVFTLTSFNTTAAGKAIVWPANQTMPALRSMSYQNSASSTDLVVSQLSTSGQVSIYSSTQADFTLDLVGYYLTNANGVGSYYVPFDSTNATTGTNRLILNTHDGTGQCTPTGCPAIQTSTTTVAVAGQGPIPVTGTTAAVFDATVSSPTATSALDAWPSDMTKPSVRSMSYNAGQTTTGTITVGLSGQGTINIATFAGSTDLTLNVEGWYQSVGTTTQTYEYNGDGLRTSKTDTAQDHTTHYVYNNATAVPQLLTDGTTDYIYAPSGAILESAPVRGSPGGRSYYLADAIGSTRAIADNTGAVVGTYRYSPYGSVVAHSGVNTPLQFAGGYTDSETGLTYFINRYYSPGNGTFTTVDPALNLTNQPYAYTASDPVNDSDPDGLCGPPCAALAGAIIGGGIDLGTQVIGNLVHGCPAFSNISWGRVATASLEGAAFAFGGSALSSLLRGGTILGDAAESADTVVLGHYPEYVDLAKATGGRTFQIPTKVWDSMSPTEQWAANQKFLDRAIARGSDIRLATPANAAREGSYFERELQYMQSRGYTVGPDGMSLIAPGGP